MVVFALRWELRRGAATVQFTSRPSVVVDDHVMVESILAGGFGVGLISGKVAERAVADGRRRRVLLQWDGPATDLYSLHHPRSSHVPRVALFLQAVRETYRPEAAD